MSDRRVSCYDAIVGLSPMVSMLARCVRMRTLRNVKISPRIEAALLRVNEASDRGSFVTDEPVELTPAEVSVFRAAGYGLELNSKDGYRHFWWIRWEAPDGDE